MDRPVLTYFDIDGGRGEPLRLAMTIGGIEFHDDRISFKEFLNRRESLPFKALPIMEIGRTEYTQSNALLRYYGRQAGLYPDDYWPAYLCDEALDVIEDATHFMVRTFGLKGEALESARADLVNERFIPYLKALERRLEAAGGKYFADHRLTIADLKIFVWTRSLAKGVLDHVPADIVEQHAPLLAGHRERIASHPKVEAYYAGR